MQQYLDEDNAPLPGLGTASGFGGPRDAPGHGASNSTRLQIEELEEWAGVFAFT